MSYKNARLEFESPRLRLHVMEEHDATEQYASWINDPEVHRFLGTKSTTIDELKDYIQQRDLKEDALFFGVFLKEDGTHIGTVKLEPIREVEGHATIAVMIGDKATWGKGYAGEAMQILIDWCFTELNLDEVRLGVIAKNTAAIRVYEKLGFTETKREMGAVKYGDEVHDQVWMTLKRPS